MACSIGGWVGFYRRGLRNRTDINYLQKIGGAQRLPPSETEEIRVDDAGSASGARLPTGRWNAMMAPARSNSVGSGPIEVFMMD